MLMNFKKSNKNIKKLASKGDRYIENIRVNRNYSSVQVSDNDSQQCVRVCPDGLEACIGLTAHHHCPRDVSYCSTP